MKNIIKFNNVSSDIIYIPVLLSYFTEISQYSLWNFNNANKMSFVYLQNCIIIMELWTTPYSCPFYFQCADRVALKIIKIIKSRAYCAKCKKKKTHHYFEIYFLYTAEIVLVLVEHMLKISS